MEITECAEDIDSNQRVHAWEVSYRVLLPGCRVSASKGFVAIQELCDCASGCFTPAMLYNVAGTYAAIMLTAVQKRRSSSAFPVAYYDEACTPRKPPECSHLESALLGTCPVLVACSMCSPSSAR